MINKFFKILAYIIIFIALIFLGYNLYHYISIKNDMNKIDKIQEELAIEETEDIWKYMEEFPKMKSKNSDFIGWIKFDSNLINQPIVFSQEDDKYLRKDFYGNYSETGTVFMSVNNDKYSRNITLYGHNVYADKKAFFAPLNELREYENYEENKYFNLYLENEIRRYEIASVVEYNIQNKNIYWQYDKKEYSKEEWEEFLEYAEKNSLYNTGVSFDRDYDYITLQTCVPYKKMLRTIVIGKEVEVRYRD